MTGYVECGQTCKQDEINPKSLTDLAWIAVLKTYCPADINDMCNAYNKILTMDIYAKARPLLPFAEELDLATSAIQDLQMFGIYFVQDEYQYVKTDRYNCVEKCYRSNINMVGDARDVLKNYYYDTPILDYINYNVIIGCTYMITIESKNTRQNIKFNNSKRCGKNKVVTEIKPVNIWYWSNKNLETNYKINTNIINNINSKSISAKCDECKGIFKCNDINLVNQSGSKLQYGPITSFPYHKYVNGDHDGQTNKNLQYEWIYAQFCTTCLNRAWPWYYICIICQKLRKLEYASTVDKRVCKYCQGDKVNVLK